MKSLPISLLLALTLCLLAVSSAFAQDEGITLEPSRDFGSSLGTGDIQGLFSMTVTGPDDLVRVEFYISDGQNLPSRVLTGDFVSAGEGWGAASNIILPVAIALLVLVLTVIVPAITTRGKLEHLPLGAERDYRFRGGAICPKCHRPFAMHLWGLNLGLGRYDRCPYCGKWSIVSSKSLAKLREAERNELSWKQAETPQKSEKDRLRKEIEDSKYQ